jgi:hypothetical protein
VKDALAPRAGAAKVKKASRTYRFKYQGHRRARTH